MTGHWVSYDMTLTGRLRNILEPGMTREEGKLINVCPLFIEGDTLMEPDKIDKNMRNIVFIGADGSKKDIILNSLCKKKPSCQRERELQKKGCRFLNLNHCDESYRVLDTVNLCELGLDPFETENIIMDSIR